MSKEKVRDFEHVDDANINKSGERATNNDRESFS